MNINSDYYIYIYIYKHPAYLNQLGGGGTNPKVDFWCSELKLSAIYFIGTGFLGFVLFGICMICGISLINICCCGEHVGARARFVHDEE